MKFKLYKTISVVLAASVCICSNAFTLVSNATNSEVIFKTDFNNISVTKSTSSANIEGSVETINCGDSDYGKVLSIKRTNNDEGGVFAEIDLGENSLKGDEGRCFIEYDFLTDKVDQWAPYIMLLADGNLLSAVGANTSSVVCSYGKTLNASWWLCYEENVENTVVVSANSWMHAKIVLDFNNKTAEYYYNNTYVGKQGPEILGDAFKNGISKLQFQFYGHAGFNPEIYIDNLSITKVTPDVLGAEIVDIKNNKTELIEGKQNELNSFFNKIHVNLTDISGENELNDKVFLTVDGSPMDYSSSFDLKSGLLTISSENIFEENKNYSLTVFNKKYDFNVKYNKELVIGELNLRYGSSKVTSTSSIDAYDNLYADVTSINTSGSSKSYVLMIECQDGNETKKLMFKKITHDNETLQISDSLKFSVPECENLIIKAFVFDDLSLLNPLCEGIEVNKNIIPQNAEFDFEGSFDDNNSDFVAYAFAKGKNSSDLVEMTDMKNILPFIYQGKTDENGNYSFSSSLNDSLESGVYPFYIKCNNNEQIKRVIHYSEQESINAYSELISKTNKNDFLSFACDNSSELGFGKYSDTVSNRAYEYLYDYCNSKTINPNNLKENFNIAEKCEILSNINNIDIFENEEVLKEELSDISRYFGESYFTDELKSEINKKLRNLTIEGINDLKSKINESFVLAIVKNSNGYLNISNILNTFAGEIGVSQSKITDAVSKKSAGNDYGNYASLKNAIIDYYDETTASKKTSGGGGGSSGRSSNTKQSASTYTTPAETKVEAKELPKNIFTDIAEDFWAKDAIVNLTEKGIVNGKDNNMFCPNDNVTREEFVKMTVLAFYQDTNCEGNAEFEDVDKNAWYYKYINKAFSEGLITGVSSSKFGIGEKITKQDMAVIIARAANKNNYNFKYNESTEKFDDNNEISEYAKESVYALKEAEILKGYENKLNPKAFTKRAEAAILLYNMISM